MGFVVRTFGVNAIRRDQLITRGPRFQISFDSNAAELNQVSTADVTGDAGVYRMGYRQNSVFESGNLGTIAQSDQKPTITKEAPMYQGRYELQRCKVDSVSLGVMPGRRVAAVRWEGVAEGITFVNKSLQEFKNGLYNTNVSKSIGSNPASLAGMTITKPGTSNNTAASNSSGSKSNPSTGNK